MSEKIQPVVGTWDTVWQTKEFGDHEFQVYIQAERDRTHWRTIGEVVQQHLGGFPGVHSIQIGAGKGTLSYLMKKEGAHITMLDFSESALNLSRNMFGPEAKEVTYVHADALALPVEMHHQYDIVLSIGGRSHPGSHVALTLP